MGILSQEQKARATPMLQHMVRRYVRERPEPEQAADAIACMAMGLIISTLTMLTITTVEEVERIVEEVKQEWGGMLQILIALVYAEQSHEQMPGWPPKWLTDLSLGEENA